MNVPPAFLEPVPIIENYRCDNAFVPRIFSSFSSNLKEVPSLVPSSASSISSDASNPPSPLSNVNNYLQQSYNNHTASQISCRHASLLQTIRPKPNAAATTKLSKLPNPFSSDKSGDINSTIVDTSGLSLSPTMMAASAAATAASAQNHAGTIVENTFLNSLSLSSNNNNLRKRQRLNQDDNNVMAASNAIAISNSDQSSNASESSFARVSFMVHGTKRTCPMGADQRMFLTKNAHIKRPRNAWIHVGTLYSSSMYF